MIDILFGGDARAFDGILIACLSAAKNCPDPLSIHILTADVSAMRKGYAPLEPDHAAFIEQEIKKYNTQSRARIIDVTALFAEKFSGSVNMSNYYSPYAFLRLLSPWLDLPDKIIYLDIDVVVRGDITELYNIDVSGYELAAAKDYHGQVFINESYFNTGVLLLNLPEIRKSGLFEKTIDMVCRRRLLMPDQSALNKYIDRILYIPPKFNRQRNPKPDTVIQHFVRKFVFVPFPHIVSVKPWEIERVHNKYRIFEYDDIFDEYLDSRRRFDDAVALEAAATADSGN